MPPTLRTEVKNGDLTLELKVFESHSVMSLWLECKNQPIPLDLMPLEWYPELTALYDFEHQVWVESELSCFWDGLQVCLA